MTFTQPQPVNQRRYGDQGLVDRDKCSDIAAEVEHPENYQIRDIIKKTGVRSLGKGFFLVWIYNTGVQTIMMSYIGKHLIPR